MSVVPLFDELAPGFDQLVPMFSAFATGLVDVMSLPPGTRLLDLGCSRGAVTRAALARGWEVVAVDAAPTMVTELRRDQPSVDARVMDAHALDLPTDAFDALAASFVIHIVDDPSQVLAEARRVVRLGGLVAMTVPGPFSDQSRWDRYFGLLRDFTPDPETAPVAPPTDVAALFAVAGLDDYRQERLEIDLPVASPELAWRHEMSHGFAGYVRSLRPDDQRELKRLALVELQRMHDEGGIRFQRGAVAHLGRVGPSGAQSC